MKQSNKTTNTLKALTLAALTLISKPVLSQAGTAGGGGGYAYTNTAYSNLDTAQYTLIMNLKRTKQSDLDAISSESKFPRVDKKSLMTVISNLRRAPLEGGTRVVDGFKQPLDMNYSIEGKYIVALDRLFPKIDKAELSDEEFYELMRKILHESSHLFGIGVNNDQDSVLFSNNLLDAIKGSWRSNCGIEGSIEERMTDCQKNPTTLYSKNSTLKISRELPVVHKYNKNGIKILDARKILGSYVLIHTRTVKYHDFKAEENLNAACERWADNLEGSNGKLNWAAASAEQVYALVPEADRKEWIISFITEGVMIADNKVLFSKSGFFKGKTVQGSIEDYKKNSPYSDYMQTFICVGTEK